jgi:4-hydroxythreonine-4-phosphate dehydrogenase
VPRPRIAITMGDPAGIGPEIIAKTLHGHRERLDADFIVVGSKRCMDDAVVLLGLPLEFAELRGNGDQPPVVLVSAGEPAGRIEAGALSPEAGHLAFSAIERAVELAMAGRVDAVVTAPINKEALHLAGHRYPGHTEIFTALTGSSGTCMLLVHERMRVAHVTTHVALEAVPRLVTEERIAKVVRLTVDALRSLGVGEPRIAVAALNPHAGEDGLFGTEDEKVLVPTIRELAAEGISIEGPVPGDTVFVKAYAGQFDAVVAMYHDQGHIPVKLLGFSIDPANGRWNSVSGVNVTLGLPIIRTSVDHGTAFDIAGKGIANEQSLVEAIELALLLTSARITKKGVRA